jgi:Xaa-Pro aminopeptidase
MADIAAAADTGWKGYSLAERDRRWNGVRSNAASAGFDCILIPKGNRLDSRYLTQLVGTGNGGVGMILPSDGRPPLVLSESGAGGLPPGMIQWVPDSQLRGIRGGDRPRWGQPTVDALLELGMERARIGVAGLGPGLYAHGRTADGVVNYTAFAEVVQKLPNAIFEDATDVIGKVRAVKSEEEIACLRRAVAIAEAGIEEMVELAKPGVDEAVLYGRVTGRLMELGSEHYGRARSDWLSHGWALETGPSFKEAFRFSEPPIGRRLQKGSIVMNEISASWGAMVAQEVQPIVVGPILDEWKPAFDLQRHVWESGLEKMKPGLAYQELLEFVREIPAPSGYRITVTMHGRGAGDDGPVITPSTSNEKLAGMYMEPGNAWVWKPAVIKGDHEIHAQVGGTVLLTDKGAERLFTRPIGVISSAS